MLNGLVLGVGSRGAGSGDDAGGWRRDCRFSVWDSRRQNVAVVAKVFWFVDYANENLLRKS